MQAEKQSEAQNETSADGSEPGDDNSAEGAATDQRQAVDEDARVAAAAGWPPLTAELSRCFVQLQQEAKRHYERLLRTAADFENHKRRSRREIRDAAERAEDRVVQSFLPIVDNLERAMQHAESQADAGGLIEGVRMVYREFESTLERYGVAGFDSMGSTFDPELHEAIQQQPSEEPKNTVVAELQRGYRRKERLVRPALVVVSAGPAEITVETEQSPVDSADDDQAAEVAVGSESAQKQEIIVEDPEQTSQPGGDAVDAALEAEDDDESARPVEEKQP